MRRDMHTADIKSILLCLCENRRLQIKAAFANVKVNNQQRIINECLFFYYNSSIPQGEICPI